MAIPWSTYRPLLVGVLLISACRFDGSGLAGLREAGPDLLGDGPAFEQSTPDGLDGGSPPSDTIDGTPPTDTRPRDSSSPQTPHYVVSTDGWALWAPLNPDYKPITAIWATGVDDVWAVSHDGLVIHRTASGWRPVATPTKKNLYGVWGSAPDDVWIVGASGTVLHFDGKNITAVSVASTKALNAVHGTAPHDVWIVGQEGTILHYNGNSWSSVNSGVTFDLLGVYAASPTVVWAAGNSKQALFCDGSSWSAQDTEGDGWRNGVFARSQNDVWLAADWGVSHYDGVGWSKTGQDPPMPHSVNAIHGDAAAIWAVGGSKVIHHGGADWLVAHDFGGAVSLTAVHRGQGVTYAGGSGWLAHDAGASWVRVIENPSYLFSVDGAAGLVWFGGSSGFIAFEDGRGWQRVDWEVSHASNVRGIWVDPTGIGWAVTEDGRIARYDKAKRQMLQQHDHLKHLYGIWGASASAIWAVGAEGSLLFSNGNGNWTPKSGAGSADWRGIWGSGGSDIYVVGGWGKIAHYNGTTWAPVAVGALIPEHLRAVHGRSASDLWVVGDKGLVWHFNGTSWSADSRPGMNQNKDLTDVYVAPSGRVWITANGDAAVYHAMPGDAAWQTHVIDAGTGAYKVKGIWGAGEEDIWTVGFKGNIRHYKE